MESIEFPAGPLSNPIVCQAQPQRRSCNSFSFKTLYFKDSATSVSCSKYIADLNLRGLTEADSVTIAIQQIILYPR